MSWPERATHYQVVLTWVQTSLVISNPETPQNSSDRSSTGTWKTRSKAPALQEGFKFWLQVYFCVLVPFPNYSGFHLLLHVP